MTATLGGNTQFTAEGFLFHPDYVGGACVSLFDEPINAWSQFLLHRWCVHASI